MKFDKDEKGFVMSGIALLLVLPAMLIAGIYLSTVSIGGEGASIATLSSSIRYTGEDAEETIREMAWEGLSIDSVVLENLENYYRAYTGLHVEFDNEYLEENNLVEIRIEDPGETAKYVKRVSTVVYPIADADGPYWVLEGENVELLGENSYDPDGTIVNYLWENTSEGDGAEIENVNQENAWFYAPAPGSIEDNKIVWVQLTVWDDDNASDEDNTYVRMIDNDYPRIHVENIEIIVHNYNSPDEYAEGYVRIDNQDDLPVENAWVSIEWKWWKKNKLEEANTAYQTENTYDNGIATFTIEPEKKKRIYKLTVLDVYKYGCVYDEDANTETSENTAT
ncbi:hypothetical protein AKJ62_04075 [candidate division MSBL1 archaeon SCGC-AAA259D14]|uniref:Uncharacterized protein n=1 Tax=candidate division MSBL1 archaeon SCGC-AAA259D14 TaxID=1698261 RepID=A0A133U452_9EURY|nr:hypothetical protein AKJ62_04075 [candidate division MSBL1 archaeon SCGC-AAA259D14]